MHEVNICAQVSLDVAWPDAIDWQEELSRSCCAWLCLRCGLMVSALGGGGT